MWLHCSSYLLFCSFSHSRFSDQQIQAILQAKPCDSICKMKQSREIKGTADAVRSIQQSLKGENAVMGT